MEIIKNSAGKTICCVDTQHKLVEIVHKGIKTLIRFLPNGDIEVIDIA
jgi:hypothetical protein